MRTHSMVGAVALTLAAAALTGCGSKGGSSGASGNYCSELKSDKTYFTSLNSSNPDFSKLDEVFTRMHQLAADSPSDVSSDWKTLDNAMTTIQNALKQAGIKPSDLAAMQKGQVPKGVDIAKLQALAPKLQQLSSSGVAQAAQRISANAKSKCGVDLKAS
jgi:hypothetical protein